MKVGFTGTRQDTTCEQFSALCRVVALLDVREWHHGCCIGADAESLEVVTEYAPGARLVAHPPESNALLSEMALGDSDEVRGRKPYLERNRDIVNETETLVACPKGPEELRSGTWSTVRFARKRCKRIVIIFPDGTVHNENAEGAA